MITPEDLQRPMLDITNVGEGKYLLHFVSYRDKKMRTMNIGFFVKQPDGSYSFEWTAFPENREDFKLIIEADRPLEKFLELWEARRVKRKARLKKNKTVIELRREYEKRNPPNNYEVICLEPLSENNFMALFLDTTPDFDNSAVRSGFCSAVCGGIRKDELEIKVGVAQRFDTGSIHLQLDVGRLKELMKKGGKDEAMGSSA